MEGIYENNFKLYTVEEQIKKEKRKRIIKLKEKEGPRKAVPAIQSKWQTRRTLAGVISHASHDTDRFRHQTREIAATQ